MLTINIIRAPGAKDLYLQLYEGIKQMIIARDIQPGEKLPSKKKLATHLKVSVKTVENAYFQLMLEGYIYSREKVGFFASNIDGFYTAKPVPQPSYTNRYTETTYRLDIKANKTPLEMFPLSVWNRIGREVMSDHGTDLLATVPFNGITDLRVAIARHLQEFRGMRVSPDQVVVGSGTEFLYNRILALLGPNSVIGMEDPGFAHIRKILETAGTPHTSIEVDEQGIRVDLLAESDATAVHVSPMHHFPLGITMPVQRRVELLQWVNDAPGRFIIEDDYNCEYLYHGSPVPPLYSLDVRKKVIYLNTFSKTVAPGIRMAYMVLPEELMERYLETLSFYSCTVPSSIQYQMARFMRDGHFERHIHRVRQHNIEQRKLVCDAIAASPLADRVRVRRNPAGTHFLLELDTNTSDAQIERALFEQEILAGFASDYCELPNPALDHLLVLNYSRITAADMDLLIDALTQAL